MGRFLEILGSLVFVGGLYLLFGRGPASEESDINETPDNSWEDFSRTSSIPPPSERLNGLHSTAPTQFRVEIVKSDSFPRTSTVNTQIKHQCSAQNTSQMKSQGCSNPSKLPVLQPSTINSNVSHWLSDNLPFPEVIAATVPKTEVTKGASIVKPETDHWKPEQPPVAVRPYLASSKPSSIPLMPDSPSTSSSSLETPFTQKPPRPFNKPVLSHAPVNSTRWQKRTNYVWVEKAASPMYMIPEDIEDLIKKDIIPEALKKPLSPSTYADYFRFLLYAEDYYLEKWNGFEMEMVTLESYEAATYNGKGKHSNSTKIDSEDDKVFVAFEMDSVPERRPFLLSRDFAYVRPSGTAVEPFQGIIYRVVKGKVLVDFGEDFHNQHYPGSKYDVKFSFNRVCLKRAHQAVESVSTPYFENFLFPDSASLPHNINSLSMDYLPISHKLNHEQASAVRRIHGYQGPVPFLVEGALCVTRTEKKLSRTGVVITEAIHQIYQTVPDAQILICAPSNNTCDVITRRLWEKIPESSMFRANAAFREIDGVPLEILPSCRYEEESECFSVPSLEELRNFKIVVSTYMSCFRLHNEGLRAGDFTRIFMLDASSTMEPEVMVALANLADQKTSVVVTGTPGNRSGWIRSKIARQNGLMTSYFERLHGRDLYASLDPRFIAQIKDM